MNNKFVKGVALSLMAACVLSVTACKEKQETKEQSANVAAITENSSFEEKAAYAIGASVGTYLRNMQEAQKEFTGDLKVETIIQGFEDSIQNKTSLDNKSIESVLRDLDKKVQEGISEKMKAEAAKNLEDGKAFLEKNKANEGVKVTESGLQYKVVTEGKGEHPKKGDTISVTYKGTTIDGNTFDEQKEPVEFPLDNMIQGWIEGLQLMSKGAEYTFYIPSDLAYGENGAGDAIKPNSVLIFDVKLVDIKSAAQGSEAGADTQKADDKDMKLDGTK